MDVGAVAPEVIPAGAFNNADFPLRGFPVAMIY